MASHPSGRPSTLRNAMLAAAILLAAVCMAAPVSAQTIRAVELWYGLYSVEDVQIVEDATAPGGQRRVGGRIIPPETSAARIPHTSGAYFGFGYRLTGANAGEPVTVRHILLVPPPGLRDQSGQFHRKLERALNLSTGRDLFIGLSMGDATPLGLWLLQVWQDDRILIERQFELYKP